MSAVNTRKPRLPPGWYPRDPKAIEDFLRGELATSEASFKRVSPRISCRAAAAPHAGWYYSGAVAAKALEALASGALVPSAPGAPSGAAGGGEWTGTVAVIGGHLPAGAPALFAPEDAVETPLGGMEIDGELRDALWDDLEADPAAPRCGPDNFTDNTVEVLLPMVKYFFPAARLLWVRFPADTASFQAGRILARRAAGLGRAPQTDLLVLGSTDLTHYGANYGFNPKGSGPAALDWMRTVNDRRFIDAVEAGNPGAVLRRAGEDRSACSAGAVLAVMGYAAETRSGSAGKCIAYGTSADRAESGGEPPDSFVGYGAFSWE